MSWFWPKNGDTRGHGRNQEIYWRGEWISKKAEEATVQGDSVKYRQVTNPDYANAVKAKKRLDKKRKGA